MVPAWSLVIAVGVGGMIGVIVGRLTQRAEATGTVPSAHTRAPGTDQLGASGPPAVDEPQRVDEESAGEGPSPTPEPLQIGMEDVVGELERRYERRRAEHEGDKPQRRARQEPPAHVRTED